MAGLQKMGSLGRTPPATVGATREPPPTPTAAGRPAAPLNRPTIFPQGPAMLGLGNRRARGEGGPGLAPADFEGTAPEWVWYFASARYFRDPPDPRVGPYTGGLQGDWFFQVPDTPDQPRAAGASISDFLYFAPSGLIIVRIEGYYWHTAANAAQQARDLYLATHAGNDGTRVEGVEDSEIMHDPTGNAAVRLLADILAGRSRVGAIHGGLAAPPRYDPELQKGPL